MAYEQLDADKIVSTVNTLHRRIVERFPNAGLANVCRKLLDIAQAARERSEQIGRPIQGVRLLSALVIAAIVGSTGWIVWIVFQGERQEPVHQSAELIQALEAGLSGIVFIGATVFFFVTLETRIKRNRALKSVHTLRCMAHIIDMHQLTKDPERLLHAGKDTESSPQRTMTQFELSRYLDYCSEMLSLTGKIAALYVQTFEDNVVVSAVNDIEGLTTDLARKIWQKLMVLHAGPTASLPAVRREIPSDDGPQAAPPAAAPETAPGA
mgnify:CR=1 FL=1